VNFVLVGIYLFTVMLFLFLTRRISPNLRPKERFLKAMSLMMRPFRKMFSFLRRYNDTDRRLATMTGLARKILQRDPGRELMILGALAREVLPGYKLKWPQIDWMSSASFNAFLRLFEEEYGYNADRRWMVYQLARLTKQVPGDTAECGVYLGASSYLICLAGEEGGNRTHHIFDSFEGLSAPTVADGGHWKEHDLACGLDRVKEKLKDFANVKYYQGWIPARFGDVDHQAFSFVHIDVDLLQPTRDSMRFFYERTSSGGIILCDDYGFGTCPGATAAIDDFLRDKPEKMISLSGGGGFLIKGNSSGSNGYS